MQLPRAVLPAFLQAQLYPTAPLPVPRSILLLTCFSIPGALTLLIVSMLDFGYLSMRVNPCISIYTLLYHLGVVLIGRRKRTPEAPSYFSTAVFSCYLLTVVWFVALILTIVVLASGHMHPYYQFAWLRLQGLPVTVHTQRAQVFLTLYETLMVGGLALKGHSIVHHEGPDPHDWRYTQFERVRAILRFILDDAIVLTAYPSLG
ncbi:hypothetical protein DXG03_000234 [Asterophora parasitica]|uniref:Uncharacterized protein n=1 Tax=Asterophora parasitica TaxID=117018 RepID=A0A9P7KHK4_9AGAR|nr:hypothetical protein DXG03_000234 [Asterophora parasitica]